MSSAATKCHVGRSTWVRTIVPSVTARSTSASRRPFDRCPIDHIAGPYSWACIARCHRTASSGAANRAPVRREFRIRRREIVWSDMTSQPTAGR